MHSIRLKITAMTIFAALTSILVMGSIGFLTLSRESDQASVEKMNLIGENLRQTLNAYFGSLQQSVEMGIHIAADSMETMDAGLFLHSADASRKEYLDATLARHCEDVEHALRSIAGNTSGVEAFYYCINSELGSGEKGFFWTREDGESFVRQEARDAAILNMNDTEHTVWYYAPIRAGTAMWTGPYTDAYQGVPVLSYSAPIYSQGFLVGVLGMDILMDTITQQIDAMRVYDTGYVYLMEPDGSILYHPTLMSGYSQHDFDSNFDDSLFQRSSSGDQLIRYTINGEQRQLAFTTLANRLKVGVSVPVSEISASRRRMSIMILGVSAVLLAVFSLLALFLTRAVIRPLKNLVDASVRLMDGDYEAVLDYDGKDEIGILTQTFRHMRDYLKLYIQDLNSRVYYDAMTGVRNKGAYDISLGKLNGRIRAGEDIAFAMVSFDCNELKHINDMYGHSQGDIYLKTACHLICQVFKHSPVFRMGGDEFAVILQGDDYREREDLIARFDREALDTAQRTEPWTVVSAARGMAVYEKGRDTDAGQVMARADQAMYEDKRRHRAREKEGRGEK